MKGPRTMTVDQLRESSVFGLPLSRENWILAVLIQYPERIFSKAERQAWIEQHPSPFRAFHAARDTYGVLGK